MIDLPILTRFASEAVRARFPLDAIWHPGNIVWELLVEATTGAFDQPHAMRIWTSADEAVAVAWFVGLRKIHLECLPDHDNLVPEMLAWAEGVARAEGYDRLSVLVMDRDIQRASMLGVSGYRSDELQSVVFRNDLDSLAAHASPPDGAVALDCRDVDAEARAACHRDAWNDLSNIGIEDAHSTFSADVYRSLRGEPAYDTSLDLVIQASTGAFVSNCICWADDGSGIGLFEPVGTSSRFRGRGFGRAVVSEGLRRLQSRGMRWARVSTAHFNAPAIATYKSCGFNVVDQTRWWTKDLVE
ncbi:MAG TPA: GNAT family N-acetyltransferase [Caulobacteraceae bacterium]|nr:GNAT family N-acetyltransferase [Caulobacteraceae bacterium]